MTISPADISEARDALQTIFERQGCADGQVLNIEPMMEGFLATVEFDDIATFGSADCVRMTATETREARSWYAICGRIQDAGWNLAFQGEAGTYGPMSDASDTVRLQTWIGRVEVPSDVSYAFDLEHDRLVARSAVTRLYMASCDLAGVSDEVLEEVARIGSVPAIVTQIERLARAN